MSAARASTDQVSVKEGVSFVVPVRNGASFVGAVLDSIVAQHDGRPFELIVIDDGSTDESWRLLNEFADASASTTSVKLIRRDGGGAAAAINAGIQVAQHPIVCQVDQDLELLPGWLSCLTAALEDPAVAAVQGYYVTDPRSSVWSRVTGLDLEQRYRSISGETDHVCTGNAAYRADALRRVGPFDEAMGYGYDNDMSYRLLAAGYRLAFCPAARATHRWREGLHGYLVQQYGFGYGRIDLVAKHRHRFAGDRVSPPAMMLHPILTALALLLFAMSFGVGATGGPIFLMRALSGILIGALAIERLDAGSRAAHRFGDRAAWLFPVMHLLRDLAWVAAMVVWCVRRLVGRPGHPSHSMRPRDAAPEWLSDQAGPYRPAT